MPLLVYTSSDFPFVPFTKIYSADVNQCYNDIKTLLNTTGLDDVNVQIHGLTRDGASSRLKAGTANAVLINDSSGNMSSEATLSPSRGGIGQSLTPTNPGDVIQVDSTGTIFTLGQPTAVPASLKYFQYLNFV